MTGALLAAQARLSIYLAWRHATRPKGPLGAWEVFVDGMLRLERSVLPKRMGELLQWRRFASILLAVDDARPVRELVERARKLEWQLHTVGVRMLSGAEWTFPAGRAVQCRELHGHVRKALGLEPDVTLNLLRDIPGDFRKRLVQPRSTTSTRHLTGTWLQAHVGTPPEGRGIRHPHPGGPGI